MEKKNIRGINELVDHMRRKDKIYLKIDDKYFDFTRSEILGIALGDLLNMLDDCEIFIDGETPSTIKYGSKEDELLVNKKL